MKNLPFGSAKVSGHVAPLLLSVHDAKRSHFLESGNEMFVEILADLLIRQGVHPERLGVVSGEPIVFEISGQVEDKQEFLSLASLPGRQGRPADKLHAGAKGFSAV
jgi:hypothetical protein